MTKEQILKKAIEKAVKEGFYKKKIKEYGGVIKISHNNILCKKYFISFQSHEQIIFSKEFARAFWGEKHNWDKLENGDCWCKICNQCSPEYSLSPSLCCWEYHLQQMVLEDDPILYLKKFL